MDAENGKNRREATVVKITIFPKRKFDFWASVDERLRNAQFECASAFMFSVLLFFFPFFSFFLSQRNVFLCFRKYPFFSNIFHCSHQHQSLTLRPDASEAVRPPPAGLFLAQAEELRLGGGFFPNFAVRFNSYPPRGPGHPLSRWGCVARWLGQGHGDAQAFMTQELPESSLPPSSACSPSACDHTKPFPKATQERQHCEGNGLSQSGCGVLLLLLWWWWWCLWCGHHVTATCLFKPPHACIELGSPRPDGQVTRTLYLCTGPLPITPRRRTSDCQKQRARGRDFHVSAWNRSEGATGASTVNVSRTLESRTGSDLKIRVHHHVENIGKCPNPGADAEYVSAVEPSVA